MPFVQRLTFVHARFRAKSDARPFSLAPAKVLPKGRVGWRGILLPRFTMESALLSPALDGWAIRPTQTLTHTRHPLRRRNVELTQKRNGTLQGGGKVFSATIVRGGSPARSRRVSRGGAVLDLPAVGTGLMFGGLFSACNGYFNYWSQLADVLKFGSSPYFFFSIIAGWS